MIHHYEGRDALVAARRAAHALIPRPEPVKALGQPPEEATAPKARLRVMVDTREQCPLRFDSQYVDVSRGTVPVFDYALGGDNGWAIERKSLEDFTQSVILTDAWRRELAKIEKARATWAPGLPIVYLAECTMDDLLRYDYSCFTSGRVTSQFAFRRWSELLYAHNAHIVWAGSREGASYAVCVLLRRRFEALKGTMKGKVTHA